MKKTQSLDGALVTQHCKALRLPSVGLNFQPWAEQAEQRGHGHVQYLEALLENEITERENHSIQSRLREASFPRMKTMEEFDFTKNPMIQVPQIRRLAEGSFIQKAEPVVFIGDCGTGKTHLMTALCVEACRKRYRVRFTTATGLITSLSEAHNQNQLSKALAKWLRYDVLAIDEVGYVPFSETSSELLFQVLAERAERKSILLTTNLPFSEWTKVFPNPRLCKALLDRITDRAHIIETGEDSFRFRRSMNNKKALLKESKGGTV